jgi:hypothetical protein
MELIVILWIWYGMWGDNGIDNETINLRGREWEFIKVFDKKGELLSKGLDEDSLFWE